MMCKSYIYFFNIDLVLTICYLLDYSFSDQIFGASDEEEDSSACSQGAPADDADDSLEGEGNEDDSVHVNRKRKPGRVVSGGDSDGDSDDDREGSLQPEFQIKKKKKPINKTASAKAARKSKKVKVAEVDVLADITETQLETLGLLASQFSATTAFSVDVQASLNALFEGAAASKTPITLAEAGKSRKLRAIFGKHDHDFFIQRHFNKHVPPGEGGARDGALFSKANLTKSIVEESRIGIYREIVAATEPVAPAEQRKFHGPLPSDRDKAHARDEVYLFEHSTITVRSFVIIVYL